MTRAPPLLPSPLRRLPLRVWCGAFPRFAPPTAARDNGNDGPHGAGNDSDDACVSVTFFGSDAFAQLRTRLRLKLLETPSITQTRRAQRTSHYSELLGLADQYTHSVVALLRYVNAPAASMTSGATSAGIDTGSSRIGASYTPLFVGIGETDLRSERLVGREHRLAFAVPVDVVLALVLLGQVHALHAEALVEQGLKLQSEAIVAAADASWRDSTQFFTRAASVASNTLATWVTGDPQVATLVKFFTTMSTQCIVLARMGQMHRAAARIACLILVDETIERLARNAAVCARYAYTVAVEAHNVADVLDDSTLSQQLTWLVHSHTIRWRAICFSYEQTIFQLDFYPEIAMYFGEMVQRGERLPSLPDYAHREDAYFTRIAQEIQQSHTAHLNELLEQKSTLLTHCQRKLGTLWTLQPLSRELHDDMITIAPFDKLFDDEDGLCASAGLSVFEMDETLTVDAIRDHVRCAKERATLETMSLSAYSMKALKDEHPPNDDLQDTGVSVSETQLRAGADTAHDSDRTRATQNQPTHCSLADSAPLTRPVSAGSSKMTMAKSHSTPSSDWVTMRVGDKVLHFEPLPSPASTKRPPRPLTAGAVGDRRRNAIPMVLDVDPAAESPARAKVRPSSSQSYLLSKKRPPEGTGALTWVPTRAPCALCERRFMRQNLPGVVVMKRIFDLRRKWGMLLQDSKKFSAASALYGRANVCVMCQDILTFEDDKDSSHSPVAAFEASLDDVGRMIQNRIQQNYLQLPAPSGEVLLDVAVEKRARQSSTNFGLTAQNAVQAEPVRTAHTKEEFQPWWEVDLGNYYVVHSVKVWLREDTCHVFSYGGGHSPHRKMGIDVPTNAIPLSSIGFLQSGTGPGLASGALAPAPQPNVGLFPLHMSVSMKTGVDRDFDDVIASAVSSHCVSEKIVQPITWITPPNCRGRFVRLQSESTAFLHIEKVNVFIAQELPTHTAKVKREQARSTLKRAAFRASVISKKLAQTGESQDDTDAVLSTLAAETSMQVERKGFASAFGDPEQAEKRRISRLYQKFKGLLDARSKYIPDERQVSFAD